ncbi:MAG: S-layer homology domain-containing protein [Planctomycetota bacterium]|jgi:hypothetical protein
MVKRITLILCIIFFLFLSTSVKAFAAELCIPVMSGNSGSIVNIPVHVDDAAGTAGFQFCVPYDCSVLSCTGATEGDLSSGWSIQSHDKSCQICVLGKSPGVTPLPSAEGSLAELQCTVVGDPGTQTNTCLTSLVLADESANEIPSTECGCSVFTATNVCVMTFSDIPSGHWAYNYISAIYCAGIATGYDDGTYKPLSEVNRAQMAIFIIRALYSNDFSYSNTPHFPDVPSGHWAFKYIQKMYEGGIATGYDDGTYKPLRTINRAQMAIFIARAILGME